MNPSASCRIAVGLILSLALVGCQSPGSRGFCGDCGAPHPDHYGGCRRSDRADGADDFEDSLFVFGGLMALGLLAYFVTGPTPPPQEETPWPHSADLELSSSADGRELSERTRARLVDSTAEQE